MVSMMKTRAEKKAEQKEAIERGSQNFGVLAIYR